MGKESSVKQLTMMILSSLDDFAITTVKLNSSCLSTRITTARTLRSELEPLITDN